MADRPDGKEREGKHLTDADQADIKHRSKALGDELDAFKGRPSSIREKPSAGTSPLGQALRMAVDPVVGVLFGLGVGLMADNAFGTKPLCLIIGLVLGGAAGMWNLVRSAERTTRSKPKS
ncbi:MAG: AtpZ/AtpI family protein [Pseudomonadota bacterium]